MTGSESRVLQNIWVERCLRALGTVTLWGVWSTITLAAADMARGGSTIELLAGIVVSLAVLPILWLAYRVAIPRDA